MFAVGEDRLTGNILFNVISSVVGERDSRYVLHSEMEGFQTRKFSRKSKQCLRFCDWIGVWDRILSTQAEHRQLPKRFMRENDGLGLLNWSKYS